MNSDNKVIISLFVVMMLICFSVGCNSPEKPSEDIMKELIIGINTSNIAKGNISNIRFDKFHIISGYFSDEKSGGDIVYCINVNYLLVYKFKDSRDFTEIVKDNENYSFIKKGNRWYGQKGWCKGN
jgi:hypothetical protein